VHPFATAIDTPLPKPQEKTHIMLGSKADWIDLNHIGYNVSCSPCVLLFTFCGGEHLSGSRFCCAAIVHHVFLDQQLVHGMRLEFFWGGST
jgi:hypothetical protein